MEIQYLSFVGLSVSDELKTNMGFNEMSIPHVSDTTEKA